MAAGPTRARPTRPPLGEAYEAVAPVAPVALRSRLVRRRRFAITRR